MTFGPSVQATLTTISRARFNNILIGADTNIMTIDAEGINNKNYNHTGAKVDQDSKPPTSLFRLPKEIRKRIFFHALRPDCALSHGDKRCTKHHIHQSTTNMQAVGNLLSTCTAVFEEAAPYHFRPSDRKECNSVGENAVSLCADPALFDDSSAADDGTEDRTDVQFFRYWSPPGAVRRRHRREEYFGRVYRAEGVPLFLEEDFKVERDVEY